MSGDERDQSSTETVLLFLLIPRTLIHRFPHFVHIMSVVHMLADSSADSYLPDIV